MKFLVHFEQTNSVELEVEADDKEEAQQKGIDLLGEYSHEQLLDKSQVGYWEFCYTDEDENNDV